MSANNVSILDSTKQLLGVDPSDTAFDTDIITHVNTAFGILRQLGAGPSESFVISDSTPTWVDWSSDVDALTSARSYVYTAVRLLFDPPATSFGLSALQEVNKEFAWRLNVEGEGINPPSPPAGIEIPDLPDQPYVPKPVHLGYQPEVTPDMLDGNVFYLTLYGDCLINSPVNGKDGIHMTMELTSDGFNVTWGSGWNWGTYGQPVLSPDGTDIISAVFREDFGEWHAGWTPGF